MGFSVGKVKGTIFVKQVLDLFDILIQIFCQYPGRILVMQDSAVVPTVFNVVDFS